MTTDHPANMSRPSSAPRPRPVYFPPGPSQQAQKRLLASPEPSTSRHYVPSIDENQWYYPSRGYGSDEDEPLGPSRSNWGRKDKRGARWMRQGKLAAWGPGLEEWEAEDRARKRIKQMLPEDDERSPSPPILPHLRSPSPPLVAPYPLPSLGRLNFTSFVMDRAVTHTFRSPLLSDLEAATNGLIEGETALRRALGKLWRAMSGVDARTEVVPKREDEEGEDEEDEGAQRIARAPDLTPAMHRLFVTPYQNGGLPVDPSLFSHPEQQVDMLERAIQQLRELEDDGREYVERLEEIREGLGDVRAQRDNVWKFVRTNAVRELQVQATEADAL
ncbi:hypothetical protein K488DRAFT_76957 [Vararia minispora EC-137]|uniref:Uncharacterized protein n=1 Tax=Vararia minispora EC-137 TaxID=1314806 RepID=A0ACB8QTR4_9AGAM|nr:hypothetical protein K488DRAFT_76957 [Vararia minispora EC-137]